MSDSPCQDHWLRNQSVGRTCSSAGFRAAVVDGDLDQDVFGRLLGVLDEHVEVAILVEHAGVEQLVLELVPAPAAAGLDEVGVREGRLRILVEVLHVRMGRRAVEVEVVFLDVLAVIAFAVGQAEQAFLEDRVLAVPQGQREAEPLLVVGDAGQAVLAPAIGAGAGLVVAEVVPGVAAFAVVLAHGAPLPLAEVRPPFLPGHCLVPSLVQANVFRRHRCLLWLSPRSWKGRSRSGRALIQYNSPDPFGSSDFSDSPTFQRLAPGESRIPVISFQIACPECCVFSSAPDPARRRVGPVDFH